MNSSCEKLRAQLDAYLSGELSGDAREEVEGHLRDCAACAAEFEAAGRLRTGVQAAVGATPVPSGLEAKVRGALRTQAARPRTGLYAVAAAALVIVCVFLINMLRTSRDPMNAILAKTHGQLAAVLKVGLRDHLQCAVFRKYSKQAEPSAQMAADLGPEFAGLIPLIQAKLPADFRLIQAHHCEAGDRQYTHFIVAGGDKVVSVILTRAQPGEAVIGIHQEGVDRFQVVGFESQGQLAYVISDLDAQHSLVLAANLAPTVRQYLSEHAGWQSPG
jgi:anti-sigma factor RsiW